MNTIFIESSNELGSFESGTVANFFGPIVSVVSGGIGTIIVVGLIALKWPAIRRLGQLKDVNDAILEVVPVSSAFPSFLSSGTKRTFHQRMPSRIPLGNPPKSADFYWKSPKFSNILWADNRSFSALAGHVNVFVRPLPKPLRNCTFPY
ncbi:MAG: hypothetical protein IPK83_12415 [Planctomycetes bacterium]|nr:hypothetical protein [Planctomycetota bacterium]